MPPAAFHFIDGVADNPRVHCIEMGELLDKYPIDVAFIGIGKLLISMATAHSVSKVSVNIYFTSWSHLALPRHGCLHVCAILS